MKKVVYAVVFFIKELVEKRKTDIIKLFRTATSAVVQEIKMN